MPKSKSKDRCLRTYSRWSAQKEYDCYRCNNDLAFDRQPYLTVIWAGDPYFAEVWVIGGKIEVRRFHDHCPFPPSPEEEAYGREEQEEELEDEWDLPMAA